MEVLTGIVERITFINEESGFCVMKIKSWGYPELVTVVGNMAWINIGSELKLSGRWGYDSRYGRQFIAQSCTETIPATVLGIEKYLGSGLIKGIGPVYAKKIVKKFKETTINIIEESIERLVEVDGIGQKRVEKIKQAWQEHKEIKNVMLFLQEYDVSASYGVKIYKNYGNESIRLVRENPYRLADDIWGIGFKTADKIAEKMGYDKDSFARCRSGIVYVLGQASNDGHCFLKNEELLKLSEELLAAKREKIEQAVESMLIEGSIIKAEEEAFYLPSLYYSELGVARRSRDIVSTAHQFYCKQIEEIIDQVQLENDIIYDDIQKDAIRTAVLSKFMILTGGPGTGKTTTILAIIKVFEKMLAKVLLAAPTGRAAKRMSETAKIEAKTIHRLLEYKPPEGYQKNVDNPLECDVLIVDEASMIDIVLMYNLLKAVPDKAAIILVGDVDQLPSVGPGNVLRDFINSGIINVVRLERIFRQAQGSMIIMNAHRINKGQIPLLKSNKESDFFFIEENETEKIAEIIKTLCIKRLPDYYGADRINDIQVISPMTRGEVGTRRLNEELQNALNPGNDGIVYGGIMYKLSDKVMQIKNNYDKNVFNGDIGRITRIEKEARIVAITYDRHEVEYDVAELDEVVLAYATTVHKSQGSEYKIVIAPLVTQHFMMLQRNLLYTCVTRAKSILILVGSLKALNIALKNNKVIKRNTLLSKLLIQYDDKGEQND